MPRLDEAALRRAEFRGGTPVRLADGQEWTLANPVVRFVPADNDAGFEVRSTLDDDAGFTAGHAGFLAATTVVEQVGSFMRMARCLLAENYLLSTADLAGLLRVSMKESDPEGNRVWNDVLDVCYGNAPKPPADGGE